MGSWNITAFGIIAVLQHYFDGLQSDIIIKSTTTGNEWRVKKRVLFYHTADRQKKFPNESTTHIHLSFASIEKKLLSIRNILDREDQNMFQYQLEPIEHSLKPSVGDTLTPVII